jgi:transcriptional repressor NrdR
MPFDRDKLLRSVQIALRKRPVEDEQIERLVSDMVRRLESQGDSEVDSHTIGELAMDNLRRLDAVAYVRFASVYKNFGEPGDFEAVLREIANLKTDIGGGKGSASPSASVDADKAPKKQ